MTSSPIWRQTTQTHPEQAKEPFSVGLAATFLRRALVILSIVARLGPSSRPAKAWDTCGMRTAASMTTTNISLKVVLRRISNFPFLCKRLDNVPLNSLA
jgi:hypothetical protein